MCDRFETTRQKFSKFNYRPRQLQLQYSIHKVTNLTIYTIYTLNPPGFLDLLLCTLKNYPTNKFFKICLWTPALPVLSVAYRSLAAGHLHSSSPPARLHASAWRSIFPVDIVQDKKRWWTRSGSTLRSSVSSGLFLQTVLLNEMFVEALPARPAVKLNF